MDSNTVEKRFAYFYFMKNDPNKIRAIVPAHIGYWKGLDLPSCSGGPFADKSGGLIVFAAPNREEATRIVMNDPFLLENLIDHKWLKEWVVDQGMLP
ncbi:MAG: hypothetical protein GXO92_06585 [FCB group bacterium]|nr:hypothetical protein [FCB group bacterium]